MNNSLADFLTSINLQPGQVHREQVNGHIVEVRLVDDDEPTPEIAAQVMLDIPSYSGNRHGVIIQAKPGVPRLPDRPVIPQDEFDE